MRSFAELAFETGSKKFDEKVARTVASFSFGELIAICNVLNLDFSGQNEEVAHRICQHLADSRRLKVVIVSTVSESKSRSDG